MTCFKHVIFDLNVNIYNMNIKNLNYYTYLGYPSDKVVDFIRNNNNNKISFDDILKSLETGIITNGKLNGV